jgi:hypothetical protein
VIPRFAFLLALLGSTSLANDGWVGFSGAPKLDGKHPTIRMVDEVVHLKIGRKVMYGDCRFTFRNEGSACTVRIGFPDYDSHGELDGKSVSTYKSFLSYVDGRRASTKLVSGSGGTRWQVKSVPFARGQTRVIRNVYQMSLGRITLSGRFVQGHEPIIWQAEYILGTGNTWRSTIGKTTIIVDFGIEAQIESPIQAREWPPEDESEYSDYWLKNRNLVIWSGPSAPRVVGKRRLIFEMKNWEPDDEGDDVSLRFGVHGKPWLVH